MIDKIKIKNIDGLIYYDEFRLDISREFIQGMYAGYYSDEECEMALLESYKRLRLSRRIELLKKMLSYGTAS